MLIGPGFPSLRNHNFSIFFLLKCAVHKYKAIRNSRFKVIDVIVYIFFSVEL